MFGVEKKRKRRKKTNYQGKAIQSFTELSVGDYVVHEEHGLGIYKGIEKVERDKVIKDYIKIEYGDGGNLYLPATRLESIQKYAGADATSWEARSGARPRPGLRARSRRLPRTWLSFMLPDRRRPGSSTAMTRCGRGSLRNCSLMMRRMTRWMPLTR